MDRIEAKKKSKLFIDANVWDGEDRHTAKNDMATFNPADLQELIDELVDCLYETKNTPAFTDALE